jgi:polysaccharide pyruvyl transferase CsaB
MELSRNLNKKQSKTVLIAGYYGFGNVGDEAILSAMLASLRARRKGLKFIVASGNPTETSAQHNVRSVYWKDIEALLSAANECDLILLGGGGVFQDYWGVPHNSALTSSHWGISYCSAVGMLAVLSQKPFAIYSVGVGPLLSEEGRLLTRSTFDLANLRVVRDTESRGILGSLGVQEEGVLVLPDPAFTLLPDPESAAEILKTYGIDPKERAVLGVCIRNWLEGEASDGWKKRLAAALDQFLENHNVQVLFIPFQVHAHDLENDHSVALEVTAMMKNRDRACILPESYPPAITGGLISQCAFIVGMRLHSLIFAVNAGIPSLALVYDPKVRNLMESLRLSEFAVDLQSMETEQLSAMLDSAWNQQKQLRSALVRHADKLRKLAQKTPVMALKLLEKNNRPPFSSETMRSLAIRQTRALAAKEQELQTALAQLETKEHENQSLINQSGALQNQLNEILSSKSWKLAQAFQGARIRLLPIGSRRERLVRWFYRHAADLNHSFAKSAAAIRQSIRHHGLPLTMLRGVRFLGVSLYRASKKFIHRNRYNLELKQLDTIISQHTGFFDLFHVPMGWNTFLFQRFQHVSLQAARLGGLALYGGHPRVDHNIIVYREVTPNLFVFDATNRQVVERIFQALQKKQQPRILRVQSIDLVTTAEDVDKFIKNGFTVVYEYIDKITPAITGEVPDLVHRRHSELLGDERVIVVATSDQLHEEVQRHRSRNFLLSTNGVDLDHWKETTGEPPDDIKPAMTGNLIVGYHGALANWMDYELLRIIADEGSYELVLIGYEHDSAFVESKLKDHRRVHFLGSKTYFELNAYAHYYDIAILPFKKTDLTQAVSPVKVFEYMAARKPIVTTDIRECRKYRSCLVASNSIGFMEQLKRAAELRTDPDYLGVLDRESRENSWEMKTIEMLRLAGVDV